MHHAQAPICSKEQLTFLTLFTGYDCFFSHIGLDGTPHVFDHGIEETAARAAERARIRDQRSRANYLRRVRDTLDSVNRMSQDDFEAFVAIMHAELGEPEWGYEYDEYDDDDDEEDEEDEDEEDDEWESDNDDGLEDLADEEEGHLQEQWLAERITMVRVWILTTANMRGKRSAFVCL